MKTPIHEQILQDIKTNRTDDWKRLIGRILREVYTNATADATTNYEDLEQEAWILLIQAANKFDPEVAKKTNATFQTYAYQNIRWGLKRAIARAYKRNHLETSVDQDILSSLLTDEQRGLLTVDDDDLLNYLCSNLSENDIRIITFRLVHNMSLREVSEHVQGSHETIRQRLPVIMSTLRGKLHELINDH